MTSISAATGGDRRGRAEAGSIVLSFDTIPFLEALPSTKFDMERLNELRGYWLYQSRT